MSRARIVAWLRRTGVCAILDGGVAAPARLLAIAPGLRRGGVRVFQLRLKSATDREVVAVARALKRRLAGCAVLVNDRADLALAAGADGVHLGQDDLDVAVARRILGARALVGISAGSSREVVRAVRQAPDYVSLGPAFPTRTKGDAGTALGPARIRRLAAGLPRSMPVLAVGGITQDNAGSLIRAGVQAMAIASWWWRHRDPEQAAAGLLQSIRSALRVSLS